MDSMHYFLKGIKLEVSYVGGSMGAIGSDNRVLIEICYTYMKCSKDKFAKI